MQPLTTAYLSLGSNLGDRTANLKLALEALQSSAGIELLVRSSLYETEPQDVLAQPWFLNAVAAVRTSLSAAELLSVLLEIENKYGRDRASTVARGPRVLDIDILFFGNLVLETTELTIPHPRWNVRRFVLEPLLEICDGLRDPVTGRSARDWLASVQDQAIRLLP